MGVMDLLDTQLCAWLTLLVTRTNTASILNRSRHHSYSASNDNPTAFARGGRQK
jgi:hypothetical protein